MPWEENKLQAQILLQRENKREKYRNSGGKNTMKNKHIGQFYSGSPHCSSPDPWSDCVTGSFYVCTSFLKESYCIHYKVMPIVITNYLPKYSQWQPFKWAYTQFSPCLAFTRHAKETVSCCCKNLNSFRAFSFQVTEILHCRLHKILDPKWDTCNQFSIWKLSSFDTPNKNKKGW